MTGDLLRGRVQTGDLFRGCPDGDLFRGRVMTGDLSGGAS